MGSTIKNLAWNVKPLALGEVNPQHLEARHVFIDLEAKIDGIVRQFVRPDWHAVTNQGAKVLKSGDPLPFHDVDAPGKAGKEKCHG